MTDTIQTRRYALEKARRDAIEIAMAEFDKQYHISMRALRDECGASEKGHTWIFTHTGPLGNPWFTCGACGTSKLAQSTEVK